MRLGERGRQENLAPRCLQILFLAQPVNDRHLAVKLQLDQIPRFRPCFDSKNCPAEALGHRFKICCDVTNPPFGPRGAAHVYGKQKGASPAEIEILDQGIQNLCKQLNDYISEDISKLAGGGAAGGTALSPTAFFGGKIISGMDFMAEVTELESKIEKADIVISGEGRLDSQSIDGKVISGVAKYCKLFEKELWLAVGKNDLSEKDYRTLGATKVYAIYDHAESIDDAMHHSTSYLSQIGKEMAKSLKG